MNFFFETLKDEKKIVKNQVPLTDLEEKVDIVANSSRQ